MSAITPSSDLRLLRVPIELDEKNQIDFNNVQAQTAYFLGISNYVEEENFTYIRQDGIIRFPACKDDIINYNYVMYRNSAYSNKWFYAFITKMEYINDNMTAISIEEDTFQTWQFDVTYKQSFIEREHVTDDTPGANLKEEGLATGDFMINSTHASTSTDFVGVVTSTEDFIEVLTGTRQTSTNNWGNPRFIGGVPSGCDVLAFPLTQFSSTSTEAYALDEILRIFALAGKSDAITGVYVVPKSCLKITYPSTNPWTALYWNSSTGKYQLDAPTLYTKWFCFSRDFILYNEEVTITRPTTIDTYTPRNKKLLTEQFNYLLVDNNSGSSAKYAYELFGTTNPIFRVYSVPTPGGSIRAIPQYYNGPNANNLAGINGGKLPIGSWDTDVYTNWLTQNGVNIFGTKLNATQAGLIGAGLGTALTVGGALVGGALTGGIGLATAGLVGLGVANGFGDVMGVMKEDYQHSIVPQQAEGNLNSGDVTFATGNAKITFYNMCIRRQYAEAIDSFFDTFGYKVNTFKVINYHTRTYWNYIKTQVCNIVGEIPQDSLMNFKKIFNSGITIWHDSTKFLDYSQSNTIIT